MLKLQETLNKTLNGDLKAVVEYSDSFGGFYNAFNLESAPKTLEAALTIVAEWAEKSAEIATSVAKDNHSKAAYDAADKAEAAAKSSGKSSDELLALWNETLHAARSSKMDSSEADEYSRLAKEARAAIQTETAAAKLAAETAALEADAEKWRVSASNEDEIDEEVDLAALEAELFG